MTEPKFKDILDVWELDYLKAVKEKLQKDTDVTKAGWMLMDRDHVLAAVRVGDEFKKFVESPPEGWKNISYKTLKDAAFRPKKTFPVVDRDRYKQLENMIRFYDPNFYRSTTKMKETMVLYFDKEQPIIIWIEQEDIAVFIAPQVTV